jgi:hypothetical protein
MLVHGSSLLPTLTRSMTAGAAKINMNSTNETMPNGTWHSYGSMDHHQPIDATNALIKARQVDDKGSLAAQESKIQQQERKET